MNGLEPRLRPRAAKHRQGRSALEARLAHVGHQRQHRVEVTLPGARELLGRGGATARHQQRMVAAHVVPHEGGRRHVTVDARLLAAMGSDVEDLRPVALRTQRVPFRAQRSRVRLVAVRTPHPCARHLAHRERRDLEDLVVERAGRGEGAGGHQLGLEAVEQPIGRHRAVEQHGAAEVTGRAGVELRVLPALGRHRDGATVEEREAGRPQCTRAMASHVAVTGLAADLERTPATLEPAIGPRVHLKAGGVTRRAAAIPVGARVEPIAGVRDERTPTAIHVARERRHLPAAGVQLDGELLQRADADDHPACVERLCVRVVRLRPRLRFRGVTRATGLHRGRLRRTGGEQQEQQPLRNPMVPARAVT